MLLLLLLGCLLSVAVFTIKQQWTQVLIWLLGRDGVYMAPSRLGPPCSMVLELLLLLALVSLAVLVVLVVLDAVLAVEMALVHTRVAEGGRATGRTTTCCLCLLPGVESWHSGGLPRVFLVVRHLTGLHAIQR